MAEPGRIDVSIEHKQAPEPPPQKHPNTCPSCGSHYREDELEASLRVCTQCGHHFPVKARERIAQIADPGSFGEEAEDLRSADPLGFFDLRSYKERLAEAEVSTGLGDATGDRAARRSSGCPASSRSWTSRSWAARWAPWSARSSSGRARAPRSPGTPLVSVSASGGARMQEGILALMQLPKTVCAVEELHESGCALISRDGAPDDRRPARELREPRRRAAGRARRADVVRRPARRRADDPREAARRLRPRPSRTSASATSTAIVPRAELRPTLARLLRLFGNA